MNGDDVLLTAWAVAEWDSATSHLVALGSVDDNFIRWSLLGRVRGERNEWCDQYASLAGLMFSDRDEVVAEARKFCTTNMSRLDELLSEKRAPM
jgi:hypothetical protein